MKRWILLITLFIINTISWYVFYHEKVYDVIVIGGEPEGVSAAVSAARNGASVLLIEKRNALGGLFTFGEMNFLDTSKGINGTSLNKGIFEEWHRMVKGASSFGIKDAKKAFSKLVENEKIDLMLETSINKVIVKKHLIEKIILHKGLKKISVKGKRFIDATQDADLSALSGVPYFLGQRDIRCDNTQMAVTFMMHFKNVDWRGIKKTAQSEKFGIATVTENAAWGFWDIADIYKPKNNRAYLRGLNITRNNEGVFINALQIFKVDGLKDESKEEAITIGKSETKSVLTFLRKHFYGFERAEIAGYPSELYVRETRHIRSLYQLPVADIWENKDHWDQIAIGGYPVDMQATKWGDKGYVIVVPIQYAIPFRSIIPLGINNLLVTSRSSGYSSLAAGSVRVVPTGMAVAEAAGVAAVLSIKNKIDFTSMEKNKNIIDLLQYRLKNQGVKIEKFKLDYPYKGDPIYPTLKILINLGLISVVYNDDNNLHLDEPIRKKEFINLISNATYRTNKITYNKIKKVLLKAIPKSNNDIITKEEAANLLKRINNYNYTPSSSVLTRREAYKIVVNLIKN